MNRRSVFGRLFGLAALALAPRLAQASDTPKAKAFLAVGNVKRSPSRPFMVYEAFTTNEAAWAYCTHHNWKLGDDYLWVQTWALETDAIQR